MKTGEIADFLHGELVGDADIEIRRVAAIESATAGELAFLEKTGAVNTKAACLIVSDAFDASLPIPVIKVRTPKLAFAKIAAVLHPSKVRKAEIHPSAVVSPDANIAGDAFIGAFVCVGENSFIGPGSQLRAGAKVGDNVTIGSNCILHPNVFVEDGCTIGNNVILHSGVVIGADGFGYVRDENKYVKFPQIGTVVIENNVEIGANSCVDRGALGETRIGDGTKIDNLVQIAHNVQIGKRVIIAAETGISGSTVIEDDCVIGGQVGMGDHVRVQSGAIIGSQAGILPGKIVRPGVWWGTPVQPLDEYKRQNAHVKGLNRTKDEIKELRRRLAELEKNKTDNS
ncbi:MAG TPA: UDP-3-O-(3-hydroxymyristoyl)glucosamine N-acyltransferase [Pyrinomonadaceae bacterium]|nr:UDP-3-O-(3-hydroxymyristoyl)glucosamine N-acyltransferase [Pyrinomonadaceae bacterium]